ncbi:MAG: LacI family DNA-binding transcriptional regulator, partial [Planctomycetes bacterium]|nr:LacI family DNA-binding transcriptional regulator [Planctomycetota bacterium]
TGLAAETVNSLLERALEHIANHELEMHELLCYSRLYRCEFLGENYREAMLPLLLEHAFQLVKVEPSDWEEYGLTPIGLVDHPDSVFANFFSDSLDANFDYQIDQQSEEGCWTPRWSWGGDYPATWAVVETEVRVELTLKFLLQLKRFDRLEEALEGLDPDHREVIVLSRLKGLPLKEVAVLAGVSAMMVSRLLHGVAAAALIAAAVVDPRMCLLFAVGIGMVIGLLVLEHATVSRWGRSRIALSFFTLNGIVSCLLGLFGVADVVFF